MKMDEHLTEIFTDIPGVVVKKFFKQVIKIVLYRASIA